MRILQLVTLLTPDAAYGGPARVALNQSAELIGRGHTVTLAAATRGYPVPPTELNGVPVQLFPARTMLAGIGVAGIGAPALTRWFLRNRDDFDIVHIHFARDLVVLPVAVAARRCRVPYVLQTHGMVVPSNHPLAPPLDSTFTRRVLRSAGVVFYLTDQECGQLSAVARGLRLVQLGNGVPRYPAAPQRPGPPEVLFAGRMHPVKRPLVFVEMAKALLDAGIDARFTLVGPDEGEGPALTAALAGAGRIAWEGALAPAAMPDRIAEATVYVLPSARDAFPMSVLEAMSVGLPVVVSAACGLAPLVARTHCGVVTDPVAPALATAVEAILADRHLAQRMGERARETVHSEFGMAAVGDRLIDAYTEVAGGSR